MLSYLKLYINTETLCSIPCYSKLGAIHTILHVLFSEIKLNSRSIMTNTGNGFLVEYSKKVKAAQQLHCLLTSSPLHFLFCSSNLAVKILVVSTVPFNNAPPSAIAKKYPPAQSLMT